MAGSRRRNNPLDYADPATPTPPTRQVGRYRLVLLLGAGATAGMTLFYASTAWSEVAVRVMLDGLLLLLWLASAAGLGRAALLPLDRRPKTDGFGILTAIGLGLGLQSLLVLGLGLAVALNRVSAIALLGVGIGGLAVWITRARGSRNASTIETDRDARSENGGRARWEWALLAIVPLLAIALIGTMFPPGLLWKPDEPHGYDVVEYHLQVPREWYEAGRILPLPHNAFSYFPFNVEMHYLLAMHLRGGPYAGMYLAQLMHLAMVVLSILAAGTITSRLTSRNPVAVVLTILAAATVPWLTQLAAMAYNEGGFLLWSILAIGWGIELLRDDSQRLRSAVLTGVMAGLACGAKLTAAPEVLVAIPTVITAIWLGKRGSRVLITPPPAAPIDLQKDSRPPSVQAALEEETERSDPSCAPLSMKQWLAAMVLIGLAGMVVFSPWLLRNYRWTGNPVFPERAATLGRGYFSDMQIERWQQAHSPQPDEASVAARVKAFILRVPAAWQFGFVLLPIGLFSLVRLRRDPAVWMLAGLMIVLTLFWIGMTHLQGRFYLLAAPLLAIAIGLVQWRRGTGVVVALLMLSCLGGWVRLHARVVNLVTGGPGTLGPLAPALASEDLSWLTADSLEGLPNGAPLLLVGEAKAFWYPQVPMSRLRYRTVFDADTSAGRGVLDAWRVDAGPQGEWILVDKPELERFEQTYQPFPPLPPEINRLPDRPVLIRPGALRR